MYPHSGMNFLPGGPKSPTKQTNSFTKALLHGPVNFSKHNQVLSLALFVAKYFVYKCNLAEDPLLFSLFKLQFGKTF